MKVNIFIEKLFYLPLSYKLILYTLKKRIVFNVKLRWKGLVKIFRLRF